MVNPYQVLHDRLAAMEDKALITGYTNPSKSTGGLHCALGAMLTNQEREEAKNFSLHLLTTRNAQRRAGFPRIVLAPPSLGDTFEERLEINLLPYFLDGTDIVRENDEFVGTPEERYQHMLKWTEERAQEWGDKVSRAEELGYILEPRMGAAS